MALYWAREFPAAWLLTLFSRLSPVSTMASTSQGQKARHGVPLSLDADIKALDRAKGACSIPRAQIAFDSASALLATIRVRSHLFRGYELQAHVDSGFHSPKAGLLRTREILR